MEPCGYDLIEGSIREQVAGELFDDELVKGEVAIEGVDDPLAIFPDGPGFVPGAAVGVGVAGLIEPVAGPAFAELGRGEEAVDDGFVGLGFDGVGREAGEIERDAAELGEAAGRRRGAEGFAMEPGQDELVDRC